MGAAVTRRIIRAARAHARHIVLAIGIMPALVYHLVYVVAVQKVGIKIPVLGRFFT